MVNPMTADLEYLRPSLRPNLLATLAANRRHAEGGLRLFELGKIFVPKEQELPDEPEVLCGLLCGDRVEQSWLGGDGNYDFYDAKGIVEALLARLGIGAGFEKGNDPGLHPAKQAAVVVKRGGMSIKLGVIGELHPKVADTFEIDAPVCLFSINVTSLLPFTSEPRQFQPIARFPGTVRDLALVVDANVTHRQVTDIINEFPLVSEVQLFDVYAGQQVGGGRKSLAYRVVYQSPSHTLTDEDVNKVQTKILKRLESELGATLRG
jgi:phenylalanyl-tRNA synthetase beta chain